jgi:hypothetical protein
MTTVKSEEKNGDSKRNLVSIMNGTFDECAQRLLELNDLGAGIYVTVNETDGVGRKAKNIVSLRAQFIDMDEGEISFVPIEPTILVQSKRGQHLYFRLKPGEDLKDFTNTQKRLSKFYKSDPTVHDLPRVMRLPGFFHMKGEPFLVTVLKANDISYSISEIVDVHPIKSTSENKKDSNICSKASSKAIVDADFKTWADSLSAAPSAENPKGGRSNTLLRIVREALGQGIIEEAVYSIADDYVARCEKEYPEAEGFGVREAHEIVRRQIISHQENPFISYLDGAHLHPYGVDDGYFVHWKETNDGCVARPLCNFVARIVNEEIYDDGRDQRNVFRIAGQLKSGRQLKEIEIPSSKFSGLMWVNDGWGSLPIVNAGSAVKDHLRVAIQKASGDVPRKHIYIHTGWRKIDNKWQYLSGSGAIGPDGLKGEVQVDVNQARLVHYSLPNPPEGDELKALVKETLNLLNLGPSSLVYPLLAAIFRAPLGEVLKIDFSIFIVGPSGVFKSEVTAIAQSFFGADFNSRNFPGNWSSTSNALERYAFLAKDTIFTIDDFAPTGTSTDIAKLHKEAERLFRGQGNNAGRERMNADGSLRTPNFSRALLLSSGEDLPRGYSLRARTLTIELSPEDVSTDELSLAQASASKGNYAKVMAAYIKWLSTRMDALKEKLPHRKIELRNEASNAEAHKRTPDIVASITLGFEQFLEFAKDIGAIDEVQRQQLISKNWSALLASTALQNEHQITEDPASRFLELLQSALTTGRVYLSDSINGLRPEDSTFWGWPNHADDQRIMGKKIGWVSEDEVLLDANMAYSEILKFSKEQESAIAVSQKTLIKRLAEKGKIKTAQNENRNHQKRTLEGRRIRVLVLDKKLLAPSVSEEGASGAVGPTPKIVTIESVNAALQLLKTRPTNTAQFANRKRLEGLSNGAAADQRNETIEASAPEVPKDPIAGKSGDH